MMTRNVSMPLGQVNVAMNGSGANGALNNSKAANNKRRAFRDVTNQGGDDTAAQIAGKKNVRVVNEENMEPRQKPRHATSFSMHIEQPADNMNNATKLSRNLSGSQSSTFSAASGSYQHTGQVDNIDERDANDPLCAAEYVKGMYEYYRVKERETSVRPTFMATQPHINERMRAILTDWLVEVHQKFKLVPETLYLTINLIDRYLSKCEVSRPKLQLVGVTALLIASKYEEIYPPELRDLVYICDRAYSKQEILDMEEKILKTLKYQITVPSAHAFLVRYLKAGHADKKMVQLSCFILDGTLQSYDLLDYLPSQLAAAAVFIARRCIGRNSWSPTLLAYADYCEEEILPVARAVIKAKMNSSHELRAVTKKYSSGRYGNVAETNLSLDF